MQSDPVKNSSSGASGNPAAEAQTHNGGGGPRDPELDAIDNTVPPGPEQDKKVFRGWRLLGVVFLVMAVLAGISALIDILVLGMDR